MAKISQTVIIVGVAAVVTAILIAIYNNVQGGGNTSPSYVEKKCSDDGLCKYCYSFIDNDPSKGCAKWGCKRCTQIIANRQRIPIIVGRPIGGGTPPPTPPTPPIGDPVG